MTYVEFESPVVGPIDLDLGVGVTLGFGCEGGVLSCYICYSFIGPTGIYADPFRGGVGAGVGDSDGGFTTKLGTGNVECE